MWCASHKLFQPKLILFWDNTTILYIHVVAKTGSGVWGPMFLKHVAQHIHWYMTCFGWQNQHSQRMRQMAAFTFHFSNMFICLCFFVVISVLIAIFRLWGTCTLSNRPFRMYRSMTSKVKYSTGVDKRIQVKYSIERHSI